jgi:hypothetical protein
MSSDLEIGCSGAHRGLVVKFPTASLGPSALTRYTVCGYLSYSRFRGSLSARPFCAGCSANKEEVVGYTAAERTEVSFTGTNRRAPHICRNHCATIFGSNRTHVPIRNDGILPAFACLKIVTLATVNILASSSAVKARPIRSIRSANDRGSAVLFCRLHDCIYPLCGFTSAATAAY